MAYKKPQERTEQEWRAWNNWLKNPVEAVKELFRATPDDWQAAVLNAVFREGHDRIAEKAAHGPGKSALDAWITLLFLNGFENSRAVLTAPTYAQVHDVLVPECAKWAGKMPDRVQDEWIMSASHIRHKCAPYEWFAVGRTSNRPENLQGFHGNHLLIIADEASAIQPDVFEVMEGALSEAGEDGRVAKLVMSGNPNFNSGELHDAFKKHRDLYTRFTITGDKTLLDELEVAQGGEHKDHGFVYYSPRVKAKYVNNIVRKYGKDSAVFDVRVRGCFPRAADDTVIPLEWAERAQGQPLPHFDPVADGFTVIVDPSRGGAAETAIGVFRKGVPIELTGHKTTSTPQICNLVHDVVLKYKTMGLRLDEVVVDEPGLGGGVIDMLRRDYTYPVRAYHGGKPLVKGVEAEEDCRMFANKRARDWWIVRRRLEVGNLPLPIDETLVAQLASVKYRYNGQERIQVESKDDMKARLGEDASPDRGDVIVMGCAPVAGETPNDLSEDDILVGETRETANYREEMDMGLV